MARTKKSNNKNASALPNNNELSMFDKAAKSIFNILDNSYNDREILTSKDQKFRSILNRELEISKGVSQGSIVDFVTSTMRNQDSKKKLEYGRNNSADATDYFTKNIGDIFTYFQDMYRNKFVEMDDLKFIAKFIPALGEAVKTVLDAVTAADNIAETVNRSIELTGSVSNEDKTAIINEIERNEKELKLLKKLKNNIYKNSIVTGTYYVYNKSYKEIFEEYSKIKNDNKSPVNRLKDTQFNRNGKATESFMLGDIDITPAMENVREILTTSKDISKNANLSKSEVSSIMEQFKEEMPTITCNYSSVYSEALESAKELFTNDVAMEAFKQKQESAKKGKSSYPKEAGTYQSLQHAFPDGTKDTNYKGGTAQKFDINGTYIKLISAKNMIPLRVFEQTIGYYILHPKLKKEKATSGEVSGITSISNTLFSSVNIGEAKKHNAVEKIVDSISEGILKNFDNKFVSDNAEYKKLIADVIIANGITDKDYNVQFVPASDVVKFTISEKDDGYGESILTDSLFPAKLLLSMMVCRILNYINKTGNKTYAHIHKGPIRTFNMNQINRVVRDLQEQNVTFNDLLSPNLVFNKFNRDGNIALPTAQDGTKLVELETQEGQQIDMDPEYEKQLESMTIIGTGVPSVIMEYIGNVDFAKQIVSTQIKFAGRIASIQSDLEEPTTMLYKRICMNSNLTDEQKIICAQCLEIKLPRPRAVTSTNNNDYIQNTFSTADSIANIMLGQDSVTNTDIMPNGTRIKEELVKTICMKTAPFIDWEEIEEDLKRIIADINSEPKKEDDQSSGGGF